MFLRAKIQARLGVRNERNSMGKPGLSTILSLRDFQVPDIEERMG